MEMDGVRLMGRGHGFFITRNLIMDSGSIGINVTLGFASDELYIVNNTVARSNGYAVRVIDLHHGWIYRNSFIYNNGTDDQFNENISQIYFTGFGGLYNPRSHQGNYWYDLDDDARKYLDDNYDPYHNFDPDWSYSFDYYPLESPSPGSPKAPGYEDMWKPTMKRETDYNTEFLILSLIVIILLVIPFFLRARALNKKDIARQHERDPWMLERQENPLGRRTPTTLHKPGEI